MHTEDERGESMECGDGEESVRARRSDTAGRIEQH